MTIPPRPKRPSGTETGRARQREDTKRRLVDAAESLIGDRGFDDVTVTDIARRAGVVPSLINTYFSGKAGLLYAIIQRHNDPQLAATRQAATSPGTARERLERIIAVWAEGDIARGRLLGPLIALTWYWPPATEMQNIRDREPYFACVQEVLRQGAAAGEFRPLPEGDICEAVFAIYVWSLRPAVFAGATAAQCVALAMARLDPLLRPS